MNLHTLLERTWLEVGEKGSSELFDERGGGKSRGDMTEKRDKSSQRVILWRGNYGPSGSSVPRGPAGKIIRVGVFGILWRGEVSVARTTLASKSGMVPYHMEECRCGAWCTKPLHTWDYNMPILVSPCAWIQASNALGKHAAG